MYTAWAFNSSQNQYVGCHSTTDHVPSGLYRMQTSVYQEPVLRPQNMRSDVIYGLAHSIIPMVTAEVEKFWSEADHYRRMGVTHKRGLLFHGPAGCGKSVVVTKLINDNIAKNGISAYVDDVGHVAACLPLLRGIEKGRPILIAIEDVDKHCNYDEEEFLEMLDGVTSLGDGILFVGTTNHYKELPERVRCRPSRFDTPIFIDVPTSQLRLEYLVAVRDHAKFDEVSDVELQKWVDVSEGFSLAMLKELMLSTVIYRRPIEESAARLREMLPKKKEDAAEDDDDDDEAQGETKACLATANV